jgi:hypothetical protein
MRLYESLDIGLTLDVGSYNNYRWGAADAWHQRALCHRDTDPIAARFAAEEALRLRDALQHPDVAASSVLLDELSAPPRGTDR